VTLPAVDLGGTAAGGRKDHRSLRAQGPALPLLLDDSFEGGMGQRSQQALRNAASLVPEIRRHVAESEQHAATARQLLQELQSCLGELNGDALDLSLPDCYLVIENGKQRPATEEQVRALRDNWRGEFLLDVPAREFRIRATAGRKTLPLGPGGLHRGLEQVLLLGMSKPGRAFGDVRLQEVFGVAAGIAGPETLSHYVHALRKKIGDKAWKSKYIVTVAVDGSVSQSGHGYAFNPRWRYLVIRKPSAGRK